MSRRSGVRGAVAFLASLCLVFAVLAGVLVPRLAQLGPGSWSGTGALGLDLPGTGSLPTPLLLLALAAPHGAGHAGPRTSSRRPRAGVGERPAG